MRTPQPHPVVITAVLAVLAGAPALGAAPTPPRTTPATGSSANCPSLLQSTQPRLQDEKPVPLCSYAGQVVLVVNTASFCGFTAQYKVLEALYAREKTRGLVVLGFPSNDFGQQEPGSNAEIAKFCENTFGVQFPMFAKSQVRAGPEGKLNPLFAALAQRTGSAPSWNFHKYLISRDGRTVISHSSAVSPEDLKFKMDLEKLLKAN